LGSFGIRDTGAQILDNISPFKVSADLVSHYIWRGSLSTGNLSPNIQPTLAYTNGNFEIGVWASTDFAGVYQEVDPYMSVVTGKFKFAFMDYNWNFSKSDYFNYKNDETGHMLEGSAGFNGTESIPITITWNTMFYGFDKNPEDSTRQAYSTYIELGYSRGPAIIFLDFTPWPGYYNNYGSTAFDPGAHKKTFSIVNIGVSVTKVLRITGISSLLLKASLFINPSASYSRNDFIHLVFGITF
jgi:hypothetical protein